MMRKGTGGGAVSPGSGFSCHNLTNRSFGVLFVMGRLRDGVAIDAARQELSALIEREAGTAFRPDMEAVLTPLDEHIFGATRPALIALAISVVLVLLIGCANVAIMLLVRTAPRAHEARAELNDLRFSAMAGVVRLPSDPC